MRLTEVLRYRRNLKKCVGQIQDWCTSKRLQLNADKTEIIWFGSKANLAKLKADKLCLHLGSVDIRPSNVVQDLGVWLDSELIMREHISRTAYSCFFHLRRLRQLRDVVCCSTMQQLLSAFVLSRLDYCNAVLSELPSTTLDPMRRSSQCCSPSRRWSWSSRPNDRTNEEAPLVANHIPYQFQVMSTMYAAVTGQCPQYIRDIVHPLSTLPGRNRLRADASGQFDIPRTRTVFGERAFSVAGPREWNTLPQDITDITNREAFKRALKTYYFKLAYDC